MPRITVYLRLLRLTVLELIIVTTIKAEVAKVKKLCTI